MQFLATLKVRPDADRTALRALLVPETRTAWEMVQEGTVRSMWQLPAGSTEQDPAGVVLVMECADESDAGRHLARFPLVQQHLVDLEHAALLPFDGFQMLFGDER